MKIIVRNVRKPSYTQFRRLFIKKESYATLDLANFRCLLSSNLNSNFLYVSISSPPTRPRCLTVLSECRSSHNQSWDAECQFIFSYGLACCFNITCV